jgi:hypothetical protein
MTRPRTAALPAPDGVPRQQWGDWVLQVQGLKHRRMHYTVRWDSIRTAAHALWWVDHLAGKNPHLYGPTCARDLAQALLDVLEPGFRERHHPLNARGLARDYIDRQRQASPPAPAPRRRRRPGRRFCGPAGVGPRLQKGRVRVR